MWTMAEALRIEVKLQIELQTRVWEWQGRGVLKSGDR